MADIDPVYREAVKKVIQQALESGELAPFLQNTKFRSWLNGTIQKAFRSYTNPTAALQIMQEFEVDQLSVIYGSDIIETIYQYVFLQNRNAEKITHALQEYKVNKIKFFEKVERHFPEGTINHGTKTEANFRSILYQGVLPSQDGMGGAGLYGVPKSNIQFAIDWGHDKDRVVKLPVLSEAQIVDITVEGEGKRVWDEFSRKNGPDKFDEFCDTFGIDILRYPYHSNAYVVKNSKILGKAKGVYRELMQFPEFLLAVKKISDPKVLISTIAVNQFSTREINRGLRESAIPRDQIFSAFTEAVMSNPDQAAVFRGSEIWTKNFLPLIAKTQDPQKLLNFLEQIPFSASDRDQILRENSIAPEVRLQAFEARLQLAPDKMKWIIGSDYWKQHKTVLQAALRTYFRPGRGFYETAARLSPEGYLYAGAPSEELFRSALQDVGALVDPTRFMGAGIYAVSVSDIDFALQWAGTKDRLLKMPLNSNVRGADITQGEGQRIWNFFRKIIGRDLELFAEVFSLDLMVAKNRVRMILVKNAAVLGPAQGVFRNNLEIFSDFALRAKTITDAQEIIATMLKNRYSPQEINQVVKESGIPRKQLLQAMIAAMEKDLEKPHDASEGKFLDREAAIAAGLRDQKGRPPQSPKSLCRKRSNAVRDTNRRDTKSPVYTLLRLNLTKSHLRVVLITMTQTGM